MAGSDPKRETLFDAVRSAQAGEPAAFGELVERTHRWVFKLAYQSTQSREDAEDLCQDVFLNLYQSLGKLKDPYAFLAWLRELVRRRTARFLRTRGRQREAPRALIQKTPPHELIETDHKNQFQLEFDDTFNRLERDFQKVLSWKYIEGASYEEIGARLSLSFHQVDYLLRRAKKSLKDLSDANPH